MRQIDKMHFEISERKTLLRVMDLFVVLSALFIVGKIFNFEYFKVTKEQWLWSVILAAYLTVSGTIFELYDLKTSSQYDSSFRNIVLTVSLTVLVYLFTPIVTPFLPEKRIEVVHFYTTMIGAMFLWRLAYINLITSPRFYKRAIIVGELSNLKRIVNRINHSDPNYKIVGYISGNANSKNPLNIDDLNEYFLDNLQDVIKDQRISEILITMGGTDKITQIFYEQIRPFLKTGLTVKDYSQVYEEITGQVSIEYAGKDFYKIFSFIKSNQGRLYGFTNRTIDISAALIGLSFGILILPFILIGNCFGNHGRLFYVQKRVGRDGVHFNIFKLRTMIKDAEIDGIKWTEKNDQRVTTFGRFLRNTRMDEIPQFFNIIRGDMSLIGPRPERPHFVSKLAQQIPFYQARHSIKPGLTGWAQVSSRYGDTIDDSLEKLQYDLYYIKHRGLFLDLNILIKTISTVLYYRGQ